MWPRQPELCGFCWRCQLQPLLWLGKHYLKATKPNFSVPLRGTHAFRMQPLLLSIPIGHRYSSELHLGCQDASVVRYFQAAVPGHAPMRRSAVTSVDVGPSCRGEAIVLNMNVLSAIGDPHLLRPAIPVNNRKRHACSRVLVPVLRLHTSHMQSLWHRCAYMPARVPCSRSLPGIG